MPKGTQHKGFRSKNKSFLIAECGFEIIGRPEGVSLKHKLHIKNCELCKLFDNKPINPNVFKDTASGKKTTFSYNNEDRKNLTKFEKKKKQENSKEKVSIVMYNKDEQNIQRINLYLTKKN